MPSKMITKQAEARCANMSMQEQLEACRREMQRASGADDMAEVQQHLNNDNWHTRLVMPIDGAD